MELFYILSKIYLFLEWIGEIKEIIDNIFDGLIISVSTSLYILYLHRSFCFVLQIFILIIY